MPADDPLYDRLLQAATHHQAGRLAQADALYREVLRLHPGNGDAHHNLGVLAMQGGRGVGEALAHFRAAWEIDPSHAQHGLSYLRALVIAGDPEGARQVQAEGARRGLAWPTVEALQGGHASPARGPSSGSSAGPGREEEEGLARAYTQRDFARFEALARSLSQRFPQHGLGWKASGVAAMLGGRREEALAALRNAARWLPEDADTQGNLGNVCLEMGLAGESEAAFRCLVALQPRNAIAHARLGDALCALNRFAEAEAGFRQALSLRVDLAPAHAGLGRALASQEKYEEALASYREALEIEPGHAEAYARVGEILLRLQRAAEAEAHCRALLARDPGRVDAHHDLGTILQQQGRLAEAEASYRRAIALRPDHLESRTCLLFLLHYAATQAPEELFAQSQAYGALARARARQPWSAWTADPQARRLRVGLVSGDLRRHPVGYFLESVLACTDRERIEWIGYPTHAQADDLTDRLRKHAGGWNSLVGLNDEDAARRIHDDGVHVLIDLAGHTLHNRLPVFAWRPARVQVTWLGYFATTGLEQMDYLLADRIGLPERLHAQFTEKIHYLPDTRLCFTPPDAAPDPAPAPTLERGFITFGCFQAQPKITDEVLQAWGRILARVPRSRLRLQNEALGDAGVGRAMMARLASQGIDPVRVDMHGAFARAHYLAAYAQVDLLLDTFPYPGGTTTCEALWMGVPTVTLAGETMIGRQGASLLGAAGLGDWIAASRDEYVAQAVARAGDLARLASSRAHLREQVRASPLFDAPRFARNLEEALRTLATRGG